MQTPNHPTSKGRHRMSEQDQQSQSIHVLMAIFNNEEDATAALDQLRRMASDGTVKLTDAAIVTKAADNKIHVRDIADPKTGRSATKGAVIGGVLGVIFPPSLLVGAAVGGAAGGLYGKFRDKGFDNKELKSA